MCLDYSGLHNAPMSLHSLEQGQARPIEACRYSVSGPFLQRLLNGRAFHGQSLADSLQEVLSDNAQCQQDPCQHACQPDALKTTQCCGGLQVPAMERAILAQLLPKDPADCRSVVLEVRAGTGGDEAALFAAELLHMYQAYCSAQSWRCEVRYVRYDM